jgi:glutathione S-transferase
MLLYVDVKFASPYAMSAFVGLHEKKIAFELKTVDVNAGGTHTPEYAATSLTQRVPTLVDGDLALSESSAITEYLHECYTGQPLYPADPKLRARARQVQAWVRSDLMPIREERPTDVIFYRPSKEPLSPAAKTAAGILIQAAEAWLKHGGDNLCGEWCIADVDLAVMLNRLVMNGDPVPQRLADYARAQWQRPSVQLWVRQKRPPLR